MTNFARCADCSALTLDTDEDARRHRSFHADLGKKLEATRRTANDAKAATSRILADVADYEQNLKDSLVTVEPETITISDMPADDELGIDNTDDEDALTDEDLDALEDDDESATASASAYGSIPSVTYGFGTPQ